MICIKRTGRPAPPDERVLNHRTPYSPRALFHHGVECSAIVGNAEKRERKIVGSFAFSWFSDLRKLCTYGGDGGVSGPLVYY